MSLLPSIKCSSCGVDIDILELADHVCNPAARSAPTTPAPTTPATTESPAPAAPPAPTAPPTFEPPLSPILDGPATFGNPSFSNRPMERSPSGRMPPPSRIDPHAANKPFRPPSPSPMSSNYSDPTSLSSAPPRSPYTMNRSATSPVAQSAASQSPNLDSFSPAAPTSRSATPSRDRLDPMFNQRYAEPSPLFAPLSPRTNGGENVTKRMDSIAPGPFDGRDDRRPGTATSRSPTRSPTHSETAPGHRRAGTQDSVQYDGAMQKQRTSQTSNASRDSAYSNRDLGQADAPAVLSPEIEGIDAFLERLEQDTLQQPRLSLENKSKSYPIRQESLGRRVPPPRPRRPSDKDLPPENMADFIPHTTNFNPPATLTRSGSDPTVRQTPVNPPAPQPSTVRSDAPSNPLHTPSDSGLSDDSYASSGFRSGASSRSSAPGSEGGHSREVSKVSRSDNIVEERPERTAGFAPRKDSRQAPPQMQDRREPGSVMRPNAPGPLPRVLSPGYPQPPRPNYSTYSDYPESPMDPAIMMGGTFNRQPRAPSPSRDPAFNLGRSPPKRISDPEPRRMTPPSKGKCRGCSEPIVGKSVKDSSGRLTGRYHKQCFACRACGDTFPTAEFYVYNNAPYCEHHYHELNGSLCRACNRGIEGQYLETDSRQKFHPRCFTCATCRIVLRDDYFEVGGRKFCGRHAQSAAAPPQNYLGPGGYRPRNVQKRRTRLMMMA